MVPLYPSSFYVPSNLCYHVPFFILEPETPPSSTLFFFLKALHGKSIVAFFLFSSVVCISLLVLLTLANGFYGLSF
jgi:hypothetical protein